MHSQGTKNMIDEIQRFVQENQALDSMDPISHLDAQQKIDDQEGSQNNSLVNTKLAKFLSLHSSQWLKLYLRLPTASLHSF